jgi:DNA polymerase-3 subunit epsilon
LFTIIDIETTGAVHKYGKITEIALFMHNGERITDQFITLVNPEMDIPLSITRLTGITNRMVSDAPRFFEIARQIVEMTTGRIFVAHNVNFDYSFVREEFLRLGYPFERKKICTVQLARKLFPGHASYSLGRLCSDFGIVIEDRHRAAGDAMATVKLFEKLLQKNRETGMVPRIGKTGNLF